MASVGDLVVNLATDTRKWSAGLNKAGSQLRTFTGSAVKSLAKVSAAAAGTAAAFAAIKGVQLAADAESMAVRMRTMLRDAEAADKLLGKIANFSAATPFQKMELNEAAAQLLAFGFAGKDVMGTLKTLGDIAAGTQKPIADFVDILGKTRAGGVAQMGEINRLADRGVPIFQALATQFGVSTDAVRKLVEQGKVTFPVLQQALERTTQKGGLFAGSMVNQSKTILGKWSTLKDNANVVFQSIGEAIIDHLDFAGALDSSTEFAQHFNSEWMPTIRDAIGILSEMAAVSKKAFDGILDFSRRAIDGIESLRKKMVESNTLFSELDFLKNAEEKWNTRLERMRESGLGWAADIESGFLNFNLELGEVDKELSEIDKLIRELEEMERATSGGILDQIGQNIAENKAEKERQKQQGQAMFDSAKSFDYGGFASGLIGKSADFIKGLIPDAPADARRESAAPLAGALEKGSADAFRAIQNAIRGGSNSPANQTAKNTKKLAAAAPKLVNGINQMADALGASEPFKVVSFNGL